jgi:NAD(P)-dependent dehydrogenase (short-subunit alcohol dehydrogenase family)
MADHLRYAIVTGGASGLGRALCVELAREGWHIGIADLNSHGAEETQGMVQKAGGTAEFLPLDVCCERQWGDLCSRLRQLWPRLDLLVNNAGVCASGAIGDAPMADWDWVMSVNLRGVALGCHSAADWLKQNPQRSWILNVSSMAGLLTLPCMSAYAASKAGVISLSEALYVELRPHNIGVSVVCPWFIRTNLLESGRFHTQRHREYTERKMATARNSPERFARIALRGTFRNRFLITLGWRSTLAMTFKALFRQSFLRVVHRLSAPEPGGSAESTSPVAFSQRTRPPSSDGLGTVESVETQPL